MNYKLVQKSRGFTLVELLVVIAIIGILVTIVLIAIDPVRVIRQSRDTKARTEANQVKTALQLYYNDNKRYPTAAEFDPTGCAAPCVNFIGSTAYMKQLPSSVDKSNYTPTTGQASYTLWSSINYETTDDQSSWDKCTTGSHPAPGGSGSYWVCPD